MISPCSPWTESFPPLHFALLHLNRRLAPRFSQSATPKASSEPSAVALCLPQEPSQVVNCSKSPRPFHTGRRVVRSSTSKETSEVCRAPAQWRSSQGGRPHAPRKGGRPADEAVVRRK